MGSPNPADLGSVEPKLLGSRGTQQTGFEEPRSAGFHGNPVGWVPVEPRGLGSGIRFFHCLAHNNSPLLVVGSSSSRVSPTIQSHLSISDFSSSLAFAGVDLAVVRCSAFLLSTMTHIL
ncbi:hypothetical protein SLEP1_g42339 [Rubroshorea leprosula]|uniref:Uncharacterized protein n=1 Tax=Rubroshorea leprosula TaxID=152421 RepID=A0AAV5LAE0_9ROSI|nr:hypothetical protein SLEP1_g42339 [Rubroshorea leprosula]